MAGPWEQYRAAPAAGPWTQYTATEAPEVSLGEKVKTGARDLAAGAVRGAGSIGATIVDLARKNAAPVMSAIPAGLNPNTTAGLTAAPQGDLRKGMDAALSEMGANTDSGLFATGKIGAEIAGSAGAGGALASLLSKGAPGLAQAIASGGFTGPQGGGQLMNWLTRIAGGATGGAATAGLVDPEQAATGAVIGGVLPVGAKVAGAAGNAISQKMEGGARRLMQSAIKPTIAQLRTGDADTAVNTLLQRGINPTQGGVNKLRDLIEGVDNKITSEIAGSTAQIDKQNVLTRLLQTKNNFTNQVSPTSDLNAIQGVADDFLAHPSFSGATIPVQGAQDLKRGTYQVLKKKYGQMGGAETEAQKALARGLKEEIATAVPAVQGLNAEQAKLITTLEVAERRALMEMNKNPMGLAALAQSPASWAMFMADKSALFKSLAARMVHSSAGGAGSAVQAIGNSAANPLLRSAAVRTPVTD